MTQKTVFYKQNQWIMLFSDMSVPEQFRGLPNLDTQIRNVIFR